MDIAGSIALVTGGASGIGRAIARALVREGARVAIADISRDWLDAAVAELGDAAFGIELDVADRAAWSDARTKVQARFGPVDILVNNAGMSPAYASHDVPESLFNSVLNLNFKGPFRLASQVAHRMSQGDGSSSINVSSTGSIMPLPGVVPYGAAKAALNAMGVSLSREYAPKVRVNTLCPGPVLTDIADAWTPEMRASQPSSAGRPGYPEEVVTAALMLASPASGYTTGALVRVDGGIY